MTDLQVVGGDYIREDKKRKDAQTTKMAAAAGSNIIQLSLLASSDSTKAKGINTKVMELIALTHQLFAIVEEI